MAFPQQKCPIFLPQLLNIQTNSISPTHPSPVLAPCVTPRTGEFTTDFGGIVVRKCNAPLKLTLPGGAVAAADESTTATATAIDGAAAQKPQQHITGFLLVGGSTSTRRGLNAVGP